MTKTIPFGELMLSQAQVNRMGKALWNDPDNLPCEPWHKLTNKDQEAFMRDFILTIPRVLGIIGLKVVGK